MSVVAPSLPVSVFPVTYPHPMTRVRAGPKTPGIFRVPGSARRITQITEAFDSEATADVENASPNDMASVLKLFLRSLPAPLLTFELYSAFLRVLCASEWVNTRIGDVCVSVCRELYPRAVYMRRTEIMPRACAQKRGSHTISLSKLYLCPFTPSHLRSTTHLFCVDDM